MPKITKYHLVSYSDFDTFERGVNHLLGKGWKPFEAPVITTHPDEDGQITLIYTQAMVLYVEDAK